jgi:hypothetical protein
MAVPRMGTARVFLRFVFFEGRMAHGIRDRLEHQTASTEERKDRYPRTMAEHMVETQAEGYRRVGEHLAAMAFQYIVFPNERA